MWLLVYQNSNPGRYKAEPGLTELHHRELNLVKAYAPWRGADNGAAEWRKADCGTSLSRIPPRSWRAHTDGDQVGQGRGSLK